jgi:hypothetical protein
VKVNGEFVFIFLSDLPPLHQAEEFDRESEVDRKSKQGESDIIGENQTRVSPERRRESETFRFMSKRPSNFLILPNVRILA